MTEKTFFIKNHKKNDISCILHEPKEFTENLVIISHGFGSSKIGPHRMFVDLARELCNLNYKVLRFDFPCNGDSEGEFVDNNFDEWIDTIIFLSKKFEHKKLCLVGNSMGGSCVIHTLKKEQISDCFVTWVADPKFQKTPKSEEQILIEKKEFIEERGTIVLSKFWKNIYEKDFLESLKSITIPGLMIFTNNDQFTSIEDIKMIQKNAPDNIKFQIYKEVNHALQDLNASKDIIKNTIKFIKENI